MLEHFQTHSGVALPTLKPGKIVCVGRNYAAHAKELSNPVPVEPVLFIKPSTALIPFTAPIKLPSDEAIHYETELAVVIGESLCQAGDDQVLQAISGIGLALDLTKRELQSRLKEKGLPWELSKAFDGACPLTPILDRSSFGDLTSVKFTLSIDGLVRQKGSAGDMLFPVLPLIRHISKHFTLLPGDVVLTGTPEGVGVLKPGMKLTLSLDDKAQFETQVLAQ
ncbi:MAG: fumarylacetoacetate hydrolase family protein [Oleiphilus sp.]|nr:MAG: fumarylacetoacetate hydrolase family protein [Oleiphilus sp.]